MKPWPRLLVLLCCLIAPIGGALRAQEAVPSPHAKLDVPADQLERSAAGWGVPPSTDSELAGRYRALFAGAGDEQLARLAEDPESGVALQAAYELAVRAPKLQRAAAFARWFDLARKRVGVALPPWWQDAVAGGKAGRPAESFPLGRGRREADQGGARGRAV